MKSHGELRAWKQSSKRDPPVSFAAIDVARDAPGYDSWNKTPLAQRMKLGGKSVVVHTGSDGKAKIALAESTHSHCHVSAWTKCPHNSGGA